MGILELLRTLKERAFEDDEALTIDVYTVNPHVVYRKVEVRTVGADGICVGNDNGGVAHIPYHAVVAIEIYD